MKKHLITTSFCCLLVATTTVAETPQAKPEAAMTLSVKLKGYGFMPTKRVGATIDQKQPGNHAEIEMKRTAPYTMPFGQELPRWEGSKEIPLGGGYQVKIDAFYMIGKPACDFVENQNGLSLHVAYYHDKQLIDFVSLTNWDNGTQIKAVTALRDVPYCELLLKSGFTIPSGMAGYDDGFRFWAAVRDGLNGRDGDTTYENLSTFLQPLNRKDNLILPYIGVQCQNSIPPTAEAAK